MDSLGPDAVFVLDECISGKKVVVRRGFALKDLQSAEEEGILQISAENLLDDIRVLRVDSGLQCAADAYLCVAKQIWWARPIAMLFGLPGFNWVGWCGYRWFNRNRYRVSRHGPAREEIDGGEGKTLV
jgi:DCC1-like thiol-disulfide oxidoreductase